MLNCTILPAIARVLDNTIPLFFGEPLDNITMTLSKEFKYPIFGQYW